jgi:hypothetical protein
MIAYLCLETHTDLDDDSKYVYVIGRVYNHRSALELFLELPAWPTSNKFPLDGVSVDRLLFLVGADRDAHASNVYECVELLHFLRLNEEVNRFL